MGETKKFTNLVTTQNRLPLLEAAAGEAGGTYESKIVPARGKAPEIVLFKYTGDLTKLRAKIKQLDGLNRITKPSAK